MRQKHDLTGKVFGGWTVLEEGEHHKDGVHWICKCVCGGIREVAGQSLRKGKSKSCGCLKTDLFLRGLKTPKGQAGLRQLYYGYRKDASKRSLSFELSIGEFQILTGQNCYYCNAPPAYVMNVWSSRTPQMREHGRYIYNGIDRKNNDLGYDIDNCVPCCKKCNTAKSDLNFSDFIDLIQKINRNLRLQRLAL